MPASLFAVSTGMNILPASMRSLAIVSQNTVQIKMPRKQISLADVATPAHSAFTAIRLQTIAGPDDQSP
jgi:hypothetical protein